MADDNGFLPIPSLLKKKPICNSIIFLLHFFPYRNRMRVSYDYQFALTRLIARSE